MSAPAEPLPESVEPMLAVAGPLPDGPEWAYEVKVDGVRALAAAGPGEWRMWSRRGEDVTGRYPELAPIAQALGNRSAVLDGEVAAFDGSGRPRFQLIQRRMGLTSPAQIERRAAETPVTFVIFDLLHLDGASTRDLPYAERRELLAGLELDGPRWQTPAAREGDGAELLEAVRAAGLEGLVAKRRDSRYLAGKRSRAWIKHRIWRRQEFVIGGWLPGEGSRSGRVGSVLVGHWSDPDPAAPDRVLCFAGAVGSGLTEEMIGRLSEELGKLERPNSPFGAGAPTGPRARSARWCEPRLVCEVAWTEITSAGTLRQPSFKGLREDRDPQTVTLDAESGLSP